MLLQVAHGRGHVVGGGYGYVVHPWSETILVELLVLHAVLGRARVGGRVRVRVGLGLGVGVRVRLRLGVGLGLGVGVGAGVWGDLHVQHDRAAQQEVPGKAGEGLGLGLGLWLGFGRGLGST